MIPRAVFSAKLSPSLRLLLALLWDFTGSPDGDPDGQFVWPSLDLLESTLVCSRQSLYRWLAELVREGWIERAARVVTTRHGMIERRGFVLRMSPAFEPETPDDGTGFLDGDDQGELDDQSEIVFALTVPSPELEPRGTRTVAKCNGHKLDDTGVSLNPEKKSLSPETNHSQIRESHPLQEPPLNHHDPPRACARALQTSGQRAGDDDGSSGWKDEKRARWIWDRYEYARHDLLGGPPPRVPVARELRRVGELVLYVRNRFAVSVKTWDDAWSMVELYGEKALALVDKALKVRAPIADALAAARCDGKEWSPERLDAVMARVDIRPRRAPPPAPFPADERPTLGPEQLGAMANDFLTRLRVDAQEDRT